MDSAFLAQQLADVYKIRRMRRMHLCSFGKTSLPNSILIMIFASNYEFRVLILDEKGVETPKDLFYS